LKFIVAEFREAVVLEDAEGWGARRSRINKLGFSACKLGLGAPFLHLHFQSFRRLQRALPCKAANDLLKGPLIIAGFIPLACLENAGEPQNHLSLPARLMGEGGGGNCRPAACRHLGWQAGQNRSNLKIRPQAGTILCAPSLGHITLPLKETGEFHTPLAGILLGSPGRGLLLP
ncbi:hypothetical protein KUCAC02_001959, partial [Chaenocephalus aceratus]